jgi:hypothetical protein
MILSIDVALQIASNTFWPYKATYAKMVTKFVVLLLQLHNKYMNDKAFNCDFYLIFSFSVWIAFELVVYLWMCAILLWNSKVVFVRYIMKQKTIFFWQMTLTYCTTENIFLWHHSPILKRRINNEIISIMNK